MPDANRRRTTYRTFRLVRPTRVVRSPEETIAVWRPRLRQYAIAAAGWLVIAIVFAMTGGGALVVGLSLAAAVLSGMVTVKAAVLVRRNGSAIG
jgi:hypothetical protein